MFKDFNKYLSTSLKVYLFVLSFLFILKLVGLNYFEIDKSSHTILLIEKILIKRWYLRDSIYFLFLLINEYVILSISTNNKSKKMLLFNIITAPLYYLYQINKIILFGNLSFISDILYSLLLVIIFDKGIKKDSIRRFAKVIIYMILVQIITMATRFHISSYITDIIANLLLNLDYTLIMLIAYKVYFMKGVENECYQVAHYSSSLKKMNLKNLLKRLQTSLHNFRTKDKVTKLTIVIYSILSFIWNTFTLLIIFLIAKINGTITECIFITTAFWITKRTFGKAFHLPNMFQCFIVSNIAYYLLNRLTTPLGISILVPILLGVGLSYITSKLVRKAYKPLYRGMPEQLFNETILKVVDKDSDKYKICYDYFVSKKNAVNLAMKYNYSEAGIRKIKDRVNKKIEELNK